MIRTFGHQNRSVLHDDTTRVLIMDAPDDAPEASAIPDPRPRVWIPVTWLIVIATLVGALNGLSAESGPGLLIGLLAGLGLTFAVMVGLMLSLIVLIDAWTSRGKRTRSMPGLVAWGVVLAVCGSAVTKVVITGFQG